MDDEKAKSLVNEKLMDYVKSVRQEIISSNSGVSKNSSHPLLKNVIGKAWVFNQFNIKATESIANDTEKMAEFEKSLADFQEKLGEYVIFIGEKEIYLQLPYSNPKQPVRSMVYAYEIEKEKENLLQIKLIAVDGIDSLSAKLKIGSEGLVLSVAEGEIFKLSELTNLNRISFKIQRNFYRHFGYLNPLKNFEPIAEPEVLEALLDY
jgi:hypothetical protein